MASVACRSRSGPNASAMSEVSRILGETESGNREAASRLLPFVYDELRRLAASKINLESPGHSFQATALVHEAYLRLVGADATPQWDGRGHFFAAAAEAMRRILVENARRKRSLKRGGDRTRQEYDEARLAAPEPREDLLALDEALKRFSEIAPVKAERSSSAISPG
jgi:RNA polymerase sigma factor (TIGR02999 family)